MYKSAEVHTKPKRRIPKSLIFVVLFIPLLIGFTLYTINNMSKRFSADGQQTTATTAASDVDGTESKTSPATADIGQNLKPEDFVPTLAEKPESKPIYNGVRQVKTFEYPVGCVDGGKSGCTCYSSQGTPLKEITKAMCKDYAKNGLPFNPYKDEQQTAQQPQAAQQTAYEPENNQVITMGGQTPKNIMYDGYVEAAQQFAQRGGVVGER